ncbi:MAG TPA: hypothetical protein VNZ57_12960 [Longimicrobiales bacterium]|nr:hypothetical protein [Longimicrobiales bacterium]
MTTVQVPATLEEATFDALIEEVARVGDDGAVLDARRLRWVDPFGMVGLLAVGAVVGRKGKRPHLILPETGDVISYLGRMEFFEHAASIFDLHGGVGRHNGEAWSDVLLEITPVRSHDDVHAVVDRVHARASLILSRQLDYPLREAFQFSVILSEVCQNIIEHSGAGGWVATQTYNWARRLGRKVVVIAVMDLGLGFRGSLASTHAARFGDRWSDATALQAAFFEGVTRFHDPGRGQGLQQIRRLVGRWGGRVSIRSGTARIADVPDWDDSPALEENLPAFPGAQICITLPARTNDAGGAMQNRAGESVTDRAEAI